MLVLHGAWGVERNTGDAAFLLWAEDSTVTPHPAPPSPVDAATPPAHPFQASTVSLRAALQTIAGLTGRTDEPVRAGGAGLKARRDAAHWRRKSRRFPA